MQQGNQSLLRFFRGGGIGWLPGYPKFAACGWLAPGMNDWSSMKGIHFENDKKTIGVANVTFSSIVYIMLVHPVGGRAAVFEKCNVEGIDHVRFCG